MAKEIVATSPAGTVYSRVRGPAKTWWNGTTFEAYTAANYSNYDIAMTEEGDSGVYTADFPSAITAGGTYEYYIHRQLGASPAEGDPVINTGKVDWTGTASVSSPTGAMTGSDFYDYVLRRGFKRTDKSAEIFEAITDLIQEMRRRFSFDEAETEATTTDTISTLGDFKLAIESDMGMLLGVILEDSDSGVPIERVNKATFDRLYPSINVETDRGYPRHFCVFAGQIYIGPMPDSVSYSYRLSYSKRAGTITSSTSGVPFTNLYRDVLADGVLSRAWEDMEEFDKATYYRDRFELGFITATRRERINAGDTCFTVMPTDC